MSAELFVNGQLLDIVSAPEAKRIEKALKSRLINHDPGAFRVRCNYPEVEVHVNSNLDDLESTMCPTLVDISIPEHECSLWLFGLLCDTSRVDAV